MAFCTAIRNEKNLAELGDHTMSELETLSRALFERADHTTTVDFKVFLGSNRDVLLEDVCAEINRVLAQGRNGMLEPTTSLDGYLPVTSVDEFLSRF
jgi:hypothetical protein